MKVYCYRNLRTRRWSIASKPKQKIADYDAVTLAGVSFVVYENQRLWCLANRLPSGKPYRQVHAYAVGEMIGAAPVGDRIAISYNPSRGGSFYRCDTGAAVTHCEYVEFNADGAYAVGAITEGV